MFQYCLMSNFCDCIILVYNIETVISNIGRKLEFETLKMSLFIV